MDNTLRLSQLNRIGVWLGIKLGILLALLYMTLFILLTVLSSRTAISSTQQATGIATTGIIVLLVGGTVGILLAAVIGGVTGWLIAVLIRRSLTRLSRVTATALGVFVGVGIALPLNVLLWPGRFSPGFIYQLALAAPSIVYVIASGFMGLRLHQKALALSSQTSATGS
jgi:hypothetical protein